MLAQGHFHFSRMTTRNWGTSVDNQFLSRAFDNGITGGFSSLIRTEKHPKKPYGSLKYYVSPFSRGKLTEKGGKRGTLRAMAKDC